MRNKLVIIVDDFGLYPKIDVDIIRWLDPRKISRISVITDLADITSLINWTKDTGVALDIHLNATIARPIMKTESTFTQLRNVPRRLIFIKKLITQEIDFQTIQDRWETQIETFIRIFNRPPDGVNSHEHVHLFPRFFQVAVELARKYSIGYIRLGERLPLQLFEYRTWILASIHRSNYAIFKESGLVTSTALYSYDWGHLDLIQIEKRFPQGTEVIFHPSQKEDYKTLRLL